ncbi:MAG: preprotein translocase subunit SecA [Clostridiales bacterium GWB2_37_7]|nr:MAG: preprotein translocase subunit SecA [Clostridiales bacterium GWB2_37_7]
MSLFEIWRKTAYNEENDEQSQRAFWENYFEVEESIYEKLLSNPSEPTVGTIKDLAEKFGTDTMTFIGFLDGINDSLKESLELEQLKEESNISLNIDLEKLYYNMLAAKAEWLYSLPQWDGLLTEERRKEITKEQRLSGTIVKDKEPGRNDPCTCGSGKKYKKCCGANK